MFNFNFLRSLITKYKAHRLNDVVNQYASVLDAHAIVTTPLVIEFYRNTISTVVSKTEENPLPVLALIDAIELCTTHYGPSIVGNVHRLMQGIDDAENSAIVAPRLKALMASIKELSAEH